MITRDIAYRDGPAGLLGFLAYDETAGGKRPGVLVVHEGLGLNEHAMERARMVAGLGYVTLAADMFGDRRQARDLEEARALIGELRNAPQKLRARANRPGDACLPAPGMRGHRGRPADLIRRADGKRKGPATKAAGPFFVRTRLPKAP